MRYIATAVAFLGTLFATAVVSVFGLISLVGPHSKPIANGMESFVYLAVGAVVLVVPLLVAVGVWRRWKSTDA
jgi:hypothetical protein